MEEEIDDSKIKQGVRYSVLSKRLEELRALERELPAVEKEAKVIPWRTIMAVAAAIVVGIFAIYFTQHEEPADPKTLYARNFEVYPNVFEPTQRGASQPGTRATAFMMYEQGNYSEAARLFTELLSEKKEPELLLLLGNANMELDRDKDAKDNFTELIDSFDGLDEQGKWFLSLVYLKTGDIDSAKKIWKELIDLKNSYSTKAQHLLNETK